jgi:hypothetical protein
MRHEVEISKVQVQPKKCFAYPSKNVKMYVVLINIHNNQTYSYGYIGANIFLLMQIITSVFLRIDDNVLLPF